MAHFMLFYFSKTIEAAPQDKLSHLSLRLIKVKAAANDRGIGLLLFP
jgi:hypothetical protein